MSLRVSPRARIARSVLLMLCGLGVVAGVGDVATAFWRPDPMGQVLAGVGGIGCALALIRWLPPVALPEDAVHTSIV